MLTLVVELGMIFKFFFILSCLVEIFIRLWLCVTSRKYSEACINQERIGFTTIINLKNSVA